MGRAVWSAFCALLIVHLGAGWSEQSSCCSSQNKSQFCQVRIERKRLIQLPNWMDCPVCVCMECVLGVLPLGTNWHVTVVSNTILCSDFLEEPSPFGMGTSCWSIAFVLGLFMVEKQPSERLL